MDILAVFGIRGRQKEIYRLEDALRAVGLHPQRAPDSVKLATLKLLKRAELDVERAVPLLAYCMLGETEFREANGANATEVVEARLRHAIDCGDSLDAELVMLTLVANVTHPDVVERFGLEFG